jgi:hypothetical protein
MVAENPKEWDQQLPYAMMAYRATPQSSTNYSPNQMMLGREVLLPLDVMYGPPPGGKELHECPTEYTEWLKQTLRQGHQRARLNNERALRSQKKYYDANKADFNLQPGVWVYWKVEVKKSKFDPSYAGPWCIVQKLNDTLYRVSPYDGGPTKVMNVDKLKVCTGDHPLDFVVPTNTEIPTQTELLVVPGESANVTSRVEPGQTTRPKETSVRPNIRAGGSVQTSTRSTSAPKNHPRKKTTKSVEKIHPKISEKAHDLEMGPVPGNSTQGVTTLPGPSDREGMREAKKLARSASKAKKQSRGNNNKSRTRSDHLRRRAASEVSPSCTAGLTPTDNAPHRTGTRGNTKNQSREREGTPKFTITRKGREIHRPARFSKVGYTQETPQIPHKITTLNIEDWLCRQLEGAIRKLIPAFDLVEATFNNLN